MPTAATPAEPELKTELVLTGVTKRYGGAQALAAADFSVRSGEVVCLLGENGAGKSTLTKVIAGIVQVDEGSIHLDGEAVTFDDPGAAHAHGIRIVPQELTLVPELSVAENVSLGHLPRSAWGLVDHRALRETARQRLAQLSLHHIDVTAITGDLGVVDQAFIQIARALTPGARILIADEPTAPMSGDEADRLLTLLESIRAAGVGVVFVSHRLDEVFRLGDRVVILRDGRTVLTGSVAELPRPEVVRAMIGEASIAPTVTAPPPSDAPPILEVEGLVARGVEELSLAVCRGEIVGVYGSTGSGREDVGPALFGAIRRRAGQIRVAGREVRCRSPRTAIRDGIGYVPAERRSQALVLELSVRENLVLAGLARVARRGLLRRRTERAVVDDWIRRLQLKTASAETPVGALSGGTQQKVVLARWLMMELPVLVLDEPTRGVDVGTKSEIYRILRDVAQHGSAVLVVSSDAEELEQVCDRVLVMRDGRVHRALGRATQHQILEAAQELTRTT